MNATFKALIERPEPVLCIDVGNSRTKACLYADGHLIAEERDFNPALARVWQTDYQPYGVIIGSVGGEPEPYLDAYMAVTDVVVASSSLALPFENHYLSNRLGVDRLAGVCGAILHSRQAPILALDAGTCLTYDLLVPDDSGHFAYLGGAISPGLSMRLKALHTFTAGLPLLSPAWAAPVAGLDTEDGMLSGALNGLLFEARGYIDHFRAQYPNLDIILTGGAATTLGPSLDRHARLHPYLVSEGLLMLYWYQKANG